MKAALYLRVSTQELSGGSSQTTKRDTVGVEMPKNTNKGGLIAVSGRKRIYTKPLKPAPEPQESERTGETENQK